MNTLIERFRQLGKTEQLIGINLAVFVAIMLLSTLGFLFKSPSLGEQIAGWLALPSHLTTLATRPWTLVTYMFLHTSFWHLFFNLLYLYFFGRLFTHYMAERDLLYLYLLGGIAGGLTYVASYNLFPAFEEYFVLSNNRGASGAAMALVAATALRIPYQPVRLFFVLEVKLWMVALGLFLFDLVSIPVNNPGGHLTHIGGALFGLLYMRAYLRGTNWNSRVALQLSKLRKWFVPKAPLKTVHTTKNTTSDSSFHERKNNQQAQLDKILDKIAVSGYESLSKEEKEFLFKVGQK